MQRSYSMVFERLLLAVVCTLNKIILSSNQTTSLKTIVIYSLNIIRIHDLFLTVNFHLLFQTVKIKFIRKTRDFDYKTEATKSTHVRTKASQQENTNRRVHARHHLKTHVCMHTCTRAYTHIYPHVCRPVVQKSTHKKSTKRRKNIF